MKRLLGILSVSVLSAALALAAGPSDEAAVKSLVAKYQQAREAGDRAALESLFTEDADQLVSSGVWRRGREAMLPGMLASSEGNPGVRTLTVETVRFIGADTALADARYVIAPPQGEARKMWSTFLALRTSSGWKFAAIRNMLPAPR
jgi:uncharacterized protein (TIGR02246 family)